MEARHGEELPDSADGRCALQLLLELGLTGLDALRFAPWLDGDRLESLIFAADNNWPAWSKFNGRPSELIGKRIRLTLEEYAGLGLWHLTPYDCTDEELKDCRKKRRREKDRKRKRKTRARSKSARYPAANDDPAVTLDPWDVPDIRAQSLALVPLCDREWWSVRALADYARSKPLGAFAGLDHNACRQAVLRAVRKLEGFGIVETVKRVERGLPVLKVKRGYSLAEYEEIRADMSNEWEAVDE
jgi:hypothetical protein